MHCIYTLQQYREHFLFRMPQVKVPIHWSSYVFSTGKHIPLNKLLVCSAVFVEYQFPLFTYRVSRRLVSTLTPTTVPLYSESFALIIFILFLSLSQQWRGATTNFWAHCLCATTSSSLTCQHNCQIVAFYQNQQVLSFTIRRTARCHV